MGAPPSSIRPAGDTIARLPRLGFGGGSIGNLYAAISDDQARQTVEAALDAGVRYFDTAPHYGFGLSERRLGGALAGRDDVVVSTKVGRRLEPTDAGRGERHGFVDADPFEPVFDYGYDAVMRSWEESRARLGRDRIDILLVHDLGRLTHGDDHPARLGEFFDGGYRAMRELRDDGMVGAIGLGVNEQAVCEEALSHGDFDVFLLAGRYTLLEQTALDGFLPLCAARGVSIIVGGPFNSGVLVEGASRQPHYNYKPAPPEIIARVSRLEAVCDAHGVPLAAAALQFPLAHPVVASVIPGLGSPAQARQAVAWLETAIPSRLWDDLRSEGLLHPDAPTPAERAAAILLHPDDNVLVLAGSIRAGDALTIDGAVVIATADVEVGHKLARRALAAGEQVFKYGAPIGSMTAAATRGDHVHLHNMKSDYIASHTRRAVGADEA